MRPSFFCTAVWHGFPIKGNEKLDKYVKTCEFTLGFLKENSASFFNLKNKNNKKMGAIERCITK